MTRTIFIFLNKLFLTSIMMSEPPKAKDGDQMCPICNKEISKHSVSEMLSCSRKIQESENGKTENDEMR